MPACASAASIPLATVADDGSTDAEVLRAAGQQACAPAPELATGGRPVQSRHGRCRARLGQGRATIRTDTSAGRPHSPACARDPRAVERFEFYCCGIEKPLTPSANSMRCRRAAPPLRDLDDEAERIYENERRRGFPLPHGDHARSQRFDAGLDRLVSDVGASKVTTTWTA